MLLIPRSHLSLVPRVAPRNAAPANGRDHFYFLVPKVQILTQMLLIPRSHLSLVPRVASRNAARANGRDHCNVQTRAAHRASER